MTQRRKMRREGGREGGREGRLGTWGSGRRVCRWSVSQTRPGSVSRSPRRSCRRTRPRRARPGGAKPAGGGKIRQERGREGGRVEGIEKSGDFGTDSGIFLSHLVPHGLSADIKLLASCRFPLSLPLSLPPSFLLSSFPPGPPALPAPGRPPLPPSPPPLFPTLGRMLVHLYSSA
jgi:hypothetical protein